MSAHIRPRFRLRVDLEPDDVMDVFSSSKERGDLPFVLHLFERQVEIGIRSADRHFWSPFLNLLIETHDGETILHGKYGPAVNLWTMFLAGYAVSGIVGSVALVLAYGQSRLGQATSGFTLFGIAATCFLGIHIVGRVGRRLAHPQMLQIHDAIEQLFGNHILELQDEEADTE